MLALVEGVDSFLLLGKNMDIAPGEVFDKVFNFSSLLIFNTFLCNLHIRRLFTLLLQFHRQLKLRNIPELRHLSGGHAVEVMAEKATDPSEFPFEPFSS